MSDKRVPCVKLMLDGEGGSLITEINHRSGWNAIFDELGGLGETLDEDVTCWRLEFVMKTRDELDTLPEHPGW